MIEPHTQTLAKRFQLLFNQWPPCLLYSSHWHIYAAEMTLAWLVLSHFHTQNYSTEHTGPVMFLKVQWMFFREGCNNQFHTHFHLVSYKILATQCWFEFLAFLGSSMKTHQCTTTETSVQHVLVLWNVSIVVVWCSWGFKQSLRKCVLPPFISSSTVQTINRCMAYVFLKVMVIFYCFKMLKQTYEAVSTFLY